MNKEQMELEIMKIRVKSAKLDLARSMSLLRPSFIFPVNVYLDGSRWVCMLETHPDPLKCPIAYGESPAQACDNFDNLWMGSAKFLVDQEDEEEQF